MAGTIYQPAKIIFDYNFLDTLPKDQWINGFAEIIKHACIQDEHLFKLLEKHNLDDFIQNKLGVANLIEDNVRIKTQIVLEDEQENNKRKITQFWPYYWPCNRNQPSFAAWPCHKYWHGYSRYLFRRN